jgi:hypothetical protein
MDMTDITITEAKAIELLREVVEGHEDYVYQKPEGVKVCVYTGRNNEPSCIVGHALAKAGVPLEVLHAIDFGGAVYVNHWDKDEPERTTDEGEELPNGTGINDSEVLYWLGKNDVHIDARARGIFAAAQREQDSGTTWGGAFARATQNAGGR